MKINDGGLGDIRIDIFTFSKKKLTEFQYWHSECPYEIYASNQLIPEPQSSWL